MTQVLMRRMDMGLQRDMRGSLREGRSFMAGS
jgi:hypothetical protein